MVPVYAILERIEDSNEIWSAFFYYVFLQEGEMLVYGVLFESDGDVNILGVLMEFKSVFLTIFYITFVCSVRGGRIKPKDIERFSFNFLFKLIL